jgi:hypothetical protein
MEDRTSFLVTIVDCPCEKTRKFNAISLGGVNICATGPVDGQLLQYSIDNDNIPVYCPSTGPSGSSSTTIGWAAANIPNTPNPSIPPNTGRFLLTVPRTPGNRAKPFTLMNDDLDLIGAPDAFTFTQLTMPVVFGAEPEYRGEWICPMDGTVSKMIVSVSTNSGAVPSTTNFIFEIFNITTDTALSNLQVIYPADNTTTGPISNTGLVTLTVGNRYTIRSTHDGDSTIATMFLFPKVFLNFTPT